MLMATVKDALGILGYGDSESISLGDLESQKSIERKSKRSLKNAREELGQKLCTAKNLKEEGLT
jgi:hypothetical protein